MSYMLTARWPAQVSDRSSKALEMTRSMSVGRAARRAGQVSDRSSRVSQSESVAMEDLPNWMGAGAVPALGARMSYMLTARWPAQMSDRSSKALEMTRSTSVGDWWLVARLPWPVFVASLVPAYRERPGLMPCCGSSEGSSLWSALSMSMLSQRLRSVRAERSSSMNCSAWGSGWAAPLLEVDSWWSATPRSWSIFSLFVSASVRKGSVSCCCGVPAGTVYCDRGSWQMRMVPTQLRRGAVLRGESPVSGVPKLPRPRVCPGVLPACREGPGSQAAGPGPVLRGPSGGRRPAAVAAVEGGEVALPSLLGVVAEGGAGGDVAQAGLGGGAVAEDAAVGGGRGVGPGRLSSGGGVLLDGDAACAGGLEAGGALVARGGAEVDPSLGRGGIRRRRPAWCPPT